MMMLPLPLSPEPELTLFRLCIPFCLHSPTSHPASRPRGMSIPDRRRPLVAPTDVARLAARYDSTASITSGADVRFLTIVEVRIPARGVASGSISSDWWSAKAE